MVSAFDTGTEMRASCFSFHKHTRTHKPKVTEDSKYVKEQLRNSETPS